jgi:sugar lactone lactonase YvrE
MYQLAAPGNFINDVVITREAAYFTNSSQAVYYRVPLGPGGELPDPGAIQTIALTGEWVQVAGFNSNGIDATPDGQYLIIVNSTSGLLYRVEATTGVAVAIDLAGTDGAAATVIAGDGILLLGKTLYVVQNRFNQIAVIEMSPDFSSGTLVRTITNPNFAVPTTVAHFGDALYAVNAKFGFANPDTIPYEVVRVGR